MRERESASGVGACRSCFKLKNAVAGQRSQCISYKEDLRELVRRCADSFVCRGFFQVEKGRVDNEQYGKNERKGRKKGHVEHYHPPERERKGRTTCIMEDGVMVLN